MELLTRILGFAVLAFGLLAILATITGTHPDPFVKWFSVALSIAITLVGWVLFRRKGAPKPMNQDPTPPVAEDTPAPDIPMALADGKTPALAEQTLPSTKLTAKIPSPVPVVTASEFKELKKRNNAFEDVKHLVGVPHQKAKSRFNILLLDEGIVLADTKTNSEVYRLQWNLLEGVETDDSRSAQDQAAGNSLMTGAIGSGKIGVGGCLLSIS